MRIMLNDEGDSAVARRRFCAPARAAALSRPVAPIDDADHFFCIAGGCAGEQMLARPPEDCAAMPIPAAQFRSGYKNRVMDIVASASALHEGAECNRGVRR